MRLIDLIFYGGLFLYAIDFNGLGNYIILGWIVLMLIFGIKRRFYISAEGIWLLGFGVVYAVMYVFLYGVEQQMLIRYLIAPGCSYYICENFYSERGRVQKGIKVLVWGLFVHGTLNMVLSLREGYQQGFITNVWGGELTSTAQGMLLTAMSALLFYGLYEVKKHKLSVIYIVCSVVSLVFSVITGRRTLVFIFFIILFVNIVVRVYQSKNIKYFLKVMTGLCAVAAVIAVLYTTNTFGIRTFFLNSNLYERLFLAEEGDLTASRTAIHLYVIKHMGNYIFGGNAPLGIASYAHNLWLDVMVMCGILPMLLSIIYSLKTVRSAIRFSRAKGIDVGTKILYMSVFLALNFAFFVEPVLAGAPHVFIMMCMMNGMVHGALRQERRQTA